MLTLVISTKFLPSQLTGSAAEVHDAISVLAYYSPIFVIGSLTAYLVSQSFDVWFFHYLKNLTDGRKLWLRNNLSTIVSQLIDTFYLSIDLGFSNRSKPSAKPLVLAAIKYVFKVLIALIDTIFIYWVKDWEIKNVDCIAIRWITILRKIEFR